MRKFFLILIITLLVTGCSQETFEGKYGVKVREHLDPEIVEAILPDGIELKVKEIEINRIGIKKNDSCYVGIYYDIYNNTEEPISLQSFDIRGYYKGKQVLYEFDKYLLSPNKLDENAFSSGSTFLELDINELNVDRIVIEMNKPIFSY